MDDDDEDDDIDYADDDLTSRPSERREAERAIREQEEEAQRRLQRPSARDRLARMTEEEMGQYFEVRHAHENYAAAAAADGQSGDMYDISQNTLLPTTRDPTLWMIKVRHGEERNTTLHLLRKCIASANAGTPLGVTSIVCKDNLKGILYVEANKQANVSLLIENVAAIKQHDIKVRLIVY